MKSFLIKLSPLIAHRQRLFLILLFLFSIIISIIETVGVAAIMPFIKVASDFSLVYDNSYYNFFYSFLGLNSSSDFVILFGVLLLLFYILRGALNLTFYYLVARFSNNCYYHVVNKLFSHYLSLSYKNFTILNSSNLTKTITIEAAHVAELIRAFLLVLSEIVVLVLLYSVMLYVNWKITFALSVILGLQAIFLTKNVSKWIKGAGNVREFNHGKMYEHINRNFANFKWSKLQPFKKKLETDFSFFVNQYAQSNIKNQTLQNVPRIMLEVSGFGIVILMVIYLVWRSGGDVQSFLPIVSLFVLALYRMLPSVNRIMSGYNQIAFYYAALNKITQDLQYVIENVGDKIVDFNDTIEIKNLSFAYDTNNKVLDKINLIINKGDKVAFKGASGCGKSTLVDLISGLHRADDGCILIDGEEVALDNIQSWRAKIGYIPQEIYLFDGTVVDNVVFNREHDKEQVIKVLCQANIYDFLMSKNGVDTLVGEGGVQLSGGQKQRIAIARALYNNPEILVLDEATSALDSQTEAKIMDEIYDISRDKTLIIVAHRISTIDKCNVIFDMRNGIVYDK